MANEIEALIAEARDFCRHPNIHFHYTDGQRVMSALTDALEQSLRSQAEVSDVKPFMFGVRDADGSAYFEEFCVSAHEEELQDAAKDIGGEVVALYARPAPIEITEDMVERAVKAWKKDDGDWSSSMRAALTAALQGETR